MCWNVSHESTDTHLSSLSVSNWCCEVDLVLLAALRVAELSLRRVNARVHRHYLHFSSIGSLQNAEVKTDVLADRGTNP